MQTYSSKIICFLHDIVESFSSMINVAFVLFEIVQPHHLIDSTLADI